MSFVSEKDCKKSWALLRDAFRRAVKKSKSGQASVPYKKWKYEDEMSFLLPHFKERSSNNISSVRCETVYEDSNAAEDPLWEDVKQDSPENFHNVAETSTPPSKRIKYSPQSFPSETPSTTLTKFLLENKAKSMNDIQQFFDSISTTVQSFPPKDRAIAKAKVFQIISEMELEILNRNT